MRSKVVVPSERTIVSFEHLIPAILAAPAIACGTIVARYTTRPLREFATQLRRLSAGDFSARPANDAIPDELREITAARNEVVWVGFISDACHELKTPLTIVMGYLDAIGTGLVTDPQHTHRILERTRAECRRMRNTVAKLAALARLDAPSEEVGSFEATGLAGEVVDLMKALSSHVHLDVPFDDDTLVSGNRNELREAVVNAIDNALKYAPGSPIEVRVHTFSSHVTIEIADAGPGMSPQDMEHAFERFYRGSSHATVEGSGLGLAIAKRAVERAGGRIVLLSELGRGTTVRISLPRLKSL